MVRLSAPADVAIRSFRRVDAVNKNWSSQRHRQNHVSVFTQFTGFCGAQKPPCSRFNSPLAHQIPCKSPVGDGRGFLYACGRSR